MDRGVVIVSVCLHEVVSCKELICRKNTVVVLSRDVHESWKTCSRSDEHCRESFLVHKVVDSDCASCYDVCLDLYAESLHVFDCRSNNLVLRKAELRNSVFKHSARTMKSLEDSHLVSCLCKVVCACKTCRTAADDCHLLAACRSNLRLHASVLPAPVSNESFELSDSYRLTLDSEDTASFALCLLRAYATADRRE